jgi:nucleoside-diphosphate-sugar epimerase
LKIVVTGASGFVGRELMSHLCNNERYSIVAVTRSSKATFPPNVHKVIVSDICSDAGCNAVANAARDADAVVHLSALTPRSENSKEQFEQVNSQATGLLARAVSANGLPHFIYLSSAHISGATTTENAIDELSPVRLTESDFYGHSKLSGETFLRRKLERSSTRWTIIRPPLVYGPGVKGSLSKLSRSVARGLPLPLGSIKNNRRDLIGLRNLASFIELCLNHPASKNEVFVIRDGQPVSTFELVAGMASAAGRRSTMIPMPKRFLEFVGRVSGTADAVQRLVGDYRIDDSKARTLLGWKSVYSMDGELQRMMASFS